jgi:hypothetical protein
MTRSERVDPGEGEIRRTGYSLPMLPHHVEVRPDADGLSVVVATFDLTAVQVVGALHALRVVRDVRHRTQEMTTDDVRTMRELTSLVDELALLEIHAAAVTLQASPARLGVLRDALDEFAADEHVERAGDAESRPVVFALAAGIGDVHASAVRAALHGVAPAR